MSQLSPRIKQKQQRRIVVYVDMDTYDEFIDILHDEGMTASGWVRKIIRQLIRNSK